MEQANRKKLLPWFLFTGLLTGSLDALLAIIINNKVPASVIFKFIASGVFGNAAFGPGNEMIYYGVLFHYFIAFTWTILFFVFYNKLIDVVKFRFVLISYRYYNMGNDEPFSIAFKPGAFPTF